jgi:hypothetical protein
MGRGLLLWLIGVPIPVILLMVVLRYLKASFTLEGIALKVSTLPMQHQPCVEMTILPAADVHAARP